MALTVLSVIQRNVCSSLYTLECSDVDQLQFYLGEEHVFGSAQTRSPQTEQQKNPKPNLKVFSYSCNKGMEV